MRALLTLMLATPTLAQDRPDVVMILADDLGYSCIGAFGGEIETPHLDALALGGLRFESFYNTARCWPTRASLMTGLYAQQTAPIIPMNANTVTIPEVLASTDYRTAMVGKWHLSNADGPGDPLDRGFDSFYGTIRGAGSFFRPWSLRRGKQNIEHTISDDHEYYYTDAIGEEAAARVAELAEDEAPFFLYVAFTAPHWPLHAPEETIEKYVDRYRGGWEEVRAARYERQIASGLVDPEVWPLPDWEPRTGSWEDADDREWRARSMATYAAMVDHMDQAVGRVVAALKETGRYDNTLILFCSDNGGCAEHLSGNGWNTANNVLAWAEERELEISVGDDHDTPTGGPLTYHSVGHEWANAQNTPLRRYKANVHEGGACSAGIAHWPRGIREPGTISREPVHVIDLAPTVYELAGADYPSEFEGNAIPPLEGRSLLPVLRGEETEERPLFFLHGSKGLRQGDWKIVREGERPWALYHLASDRSETRDLAGDLPRRTLAMVTRWNEWHARVARR